MIEYTEFLKTKQKRIIESGFEVACKNIRNAVEIKTQSTFNFDNPDIDIKVGCLRD